MKITTSFPRIFGEPVWRDSEYICTFADSDRLLGHAILTNSQWHAYDGTKQAADGCGFRFLGTFKDSYDAKDAIERSVGQLSAMTRTAGGSFSH